MSWLKFCVPVASETVEDQEKEEDEVKEKKQDEKDECPVSQ